jgi:hypothetical protein
MYIYTYIHIYVYKTIYFKTLHIYIHLVYISFRKCFTTFTCSLQCDFIYSSEKCYKLMSTSFCHLTLAGCLLRLTILTPKMEAVCLSKTPLNFYHTTWCYIPEGSTLHIQEESIPKTYMAIPLRSAYGLPGQEQA